MAARFEIVRFVALCGLLYGLTGTGAHGATQVFGDGQQSAFASAAGPLTLQDFNGTFTTDATNPNPLSFPNFTVEETVGTPNLHKFAQGAFEFLHFQSDTPSTVVFTFAQPITAFGVSTVDFAREAGLALGQTETITYADNSPGAGAPITVVSRTSGGSVGVGNFFGVIRDDPFTIVSLTASTGVTSIGPFNGDDIGLENLQFAVVPLPAAGWLLLSAFVGLRWIKRRGQPSS
ncbi:MAG: VPLPA-CTERM sorting domain-containing protein [Gammaproteobacteria bacterium]|nr:VPLPA-CTERM sorting domain-containing protein [Gammaproteobacteria bacterium]